MIAKDFRHSAWEALRGHWGVALLTGLIASILGGGIANFGGFNINLNLDAEHIKLFRHHFAVSGGDIGGIFAAAMPFLVGAGIAAAVWTVVSLVVGGAVSLGYAQFNLDVIDRQEPQIATLFSKFSKLGTGVAMRLLTGLFIFLWSLLFIIPGIIASYRYAMTPYILAENPDMGVMDAIDASKKMMQGNKFRLFCLHFSFIGWHLLTALTLGILSLWVHPYTEAANAAFYREISGSRPADSAEEENFESDGWSYGSSWGPEN
jgi:uncharacterized membrane protein